MLSLCYQRHFGRGGKPCSCWVSEFQPLFPLEVQRHKLLINVASSLAFGVVFREFRLFCFGSQEKCTQSVLTSFVPIVFSWSDVRKGCCVSLGNCIHVDLYKPSAIRTSANQPQPGAAFICFDINIRKNTVQVFENIPVI